jgi:hypothetical protein
MARRNEHNKEVRHDGVPSASEYDLATPLWSRYYRAMRKRVRFPRYYKRALNW